MLICTCTHAEPRRKNRSYVNGLMDAKRKGHRYVQGAEGEMAIGVR